MLTLRTLHFLFSFDMSLWLLVPERTSSFTTDAISSQGIFGENQTRKFKVNDQQIVLNCELQREVDLRRKLSSCDDLTRIQSLGCYNKGFTS